MSRFVSFECHGRAVAKERPRVTRTVTGARTRTVTHTPAKTAAWEEAVSWAAKAALRGRGALEGDVGVDLDFRFVPPASWPQGRRQAALGRHARTRSDVDNLAKAVLDACNGLGRVYTNVAHRR